MDCTVVGLREGGVAADALGKLVRAFGVANRDRQRALDGFGGIDTTGRLAPRQSLLHSPTPSFANGLAGVAAGTGHGLAIELRKKFVVRMPWFKALRGTFAIDFS